VQLLILFKPSALGTAGAAVQVGCVSVEKTACAPGAIAYNQMRGVSGSISLCRVLPAENGELQMTEMKIRAALLAGVVAGLLTPVLIQAQGTGSQAGASTPVAAPEAAPLVGASWHPNNEYWHHHDQLLLTDFGWLARFKDEDLKLGLPAAGEDRVVFMGDSITEGWHLDKSFPGKPYVNRGISGQTTAQMVLRFHQDVIALKPKVVVILAGINDMAENTGPMTLEQTEDNLAAMTEMAAANGIKVVMCSVLPATHFSWHPGLEPASEVAAANVWMKAYADQKGFVYVDFYSAMKDDMGGLPPNLSRDGVHPLPAGHAIMDPLAEAGIEKALKTGKKK